MNEFISVIYRVIIHTNRNSETCSYIYYNIKTREWFESVGYTQSEPFVHISLFIILEGCTGFKFYTSFLLFLFFGIRTERSDHTHWMYW